MRQRASDLKVEFDDKTEELEFIMENIVQPASMNNVASVLCNLYESDATAAADPSVNRRIAVHLRCGTFNVLHQISYYLVRYFFESYMRHMTLAEMSRAVGTIMKSDNVVIVNRGFTCNWIRLYTLLARISKQRLGDNLYSTEMPVAHLYLYSKNFNAWCVTAFDLQGCISYEKEIEAFYSPEHVEEFTFDRT